MAPFSSFWDFWPSFPFLTSFLTFLFTRPFHLGPWFTLVFFVILVLLLMLSSHEQRLTQQITDRQKMESTSSNELEQLRCQAYATNSLVPRTSQRHCLFVYGTRYTDCAANRRLFGIFSAFHVLSWVLKLEENHNKPNLSKLLWSHCQHFLIEWPSFVAISFGGCRYFLAHVTCWNLPWQGLMWGLKAMLPGFASSRSGLHLGAGC